MTSGIYKLTFSDGSYYIGKSSDITRRWGQHQESMSKGTHTKKLQQAFDIHGDPEYEILLECHEDHIDIMESLYINTNWGPSILNATRPTAWNQDDIDFLDRINSEVWTVSTIQHLRNWLQTQKEVNRLKDRISGLKDGSLVYSLEYELQELRSKIYNLRSRGFFARLFNWD
jgi:hypothetical protein